MNKMKLTDAVVIPVMTAHNITREEAEKRLHLLGESGILNGHPGDPETQILIDGFLAQDSEVLAETVLFEKTFTKCMGNKEFVKEYDRLTNTNLAKVLREMEAGNVPKNAKKEFERFERFVRQTVFARVEKAM